MGCWPEVMSGGDTWYWVTWYEMMGSDRDPSVTRYEMYGTMSLGFWRLSARAWEMSGRPGGSRHVADAVLSLSLRSLWWWSKGSAAGLELSPKAQVSVAVSRPF